MWSSQKEKRKKMKTILNISKTGPDKQFLSLSEDNKDGKDVFIIKQDESEIKLLLKDIYNISGQMNSWYYRIKNICVHRDCDDEQRMPGSIFCSKHDKEVRDNFNKNRG